MPSCGMWRRVSVERITSIIVFLCTVLRLLVTVNVPISPILVTRMMEAIRSSETSVLTRGTRRHVPEDGTLHGLYRLIVCVEP
jgi:hypothetical protein